MTAKKKILKTIAAVAVIIAALAAVSVLMVNFSVKNSVEDKIIYTVTGDTAFESTRAGLHTNTGSGHH